VRAQPTLKKSRSGVHQKELRHPVSAGLRNAMSVRSDLERVIRIELGECERAIQNGDLTKALRELDYAMRKLKEIERKITRLERRPAQ
jgi:hypothetical protein